MNTNYILSRWALFATLLAIVSACSKSSECQSADDCFVGEVCLDGLCILSDRSNNPSEDPDPRVPDTGGPDAGSGGDDVSSVDIGVDLPAACVGTRHQTCEDRDPEDKVADTRSAALSAIPGSAAGCKDNQGSVFTEFDPGEPVFQGRICPIEETGDWFFVILNTCSDRPVRAEFRVKILSCPAEMVEVEIFRHQTKIDCADEALECAVEGDELVYRIFIPAQPRAEFQWWYAGIGSRVPLGTFDYDLYYRVY